ncbi:MAG: hypothetical protein IRY99_01520 [Isosphaeraceae bacterium]|nr:hypothetical protein [Isosphaeraceae bacterium]
MANAVRVLHRLLRDDERWVESLRDGQIEVPLGGMLALVLVLGMGFGLCMGGYALSRPTGPYYAQAMATVLKVPLVFVLTLLLTYPSLYLINLLVGPRLGAAAVLRLLAAMFGVMAAVLASLGPVVAIFACTAGYSFTVLFIVAAGAVSGWTGLVFLFRTLGRLAPASVAAPIGRPCPRNEEGEACAPRTLPAPAAGRRAAAFRQGARLALVGWGLMFGLVGIQVGWSMRPILGWTGWRWEEAQLASKASFTLIRFDDLSFIEGIRYEVQNLFHR